MTLALAMALTGQRSAIMDGADMIVEGET